MPPLQLGELVPGTRYRRDSFTSFEPSEDGPVVGSVTKAFDRPRLEDTPARLPGVQEDVVETMPAQGRSPRPTQHVGRPIDEGVEMAEDIEPGCPRPAAPGGGVSGGVVAPA